MASSYWKRREEWYYIHNGTYYSKIGTPFDRLQAAMQYDDIRPDDIVVAGYPKSGIHLVSDVAKKLRNKGDVNKSHKEACDVFLETVSHEITQYNRDAHTPLSLQEISALESPRVIMTHLRFNELPPKVQEGHCKIIYILRDPRDAACSWFNMQRKFQKVLVDRKLITDQQELNDWDEYISEFVNGNVFYGSWCDHTKSFLRARNKSHILWIRFEELTRNMGDEIKRIQTFMGENLDEASLSAIVDSCRITNMRKVFPDSIFISKGDVGSWKNWFTVAQLEALQKKIAEEMKDYKEDLSQCLL